MSSRNSKKPMDKKSMAIMWVIIAAIMVYAGASDGDAIIPAASTLIVTTIIIFVSMAANKKSAAKAPAKEQPVRPEPARVPAARTEASRLRARRGLWIWAVILSLAALVLLPKERLGMTLRLFDRYGFERAMHILTQADRGSLIGLSIFAVLALICVIGALRIPALSRRITREPDNIPASRPVRAARKAPATEEAISCAHHTGREKYMQQLDSYLKAGLIDKAEYRTLKERYAKLDIPEDYH